VAPAGCEQRGWGSSKARMNYLRFILTFVKAGALYQFFELHYREGEAVILYFSVSNAIIFALWL